LRKKISLFLIRLLLNNRVYYDSSKYYQELIYFKKLRIKCFIIRLANKYPESCVLLVFKSLIVNKKITNSTDFSKNEIYEKLQNEELNLSILGYTKLTYFKDNYFRLCEYLFNSVYDSSALESENFEFKSYIFDKNDFKLQNFDESITSCPNLYLKVVDERLVKSFDCISLPPDWTHLGHISLIEKGKLYLYF